MSTRTAIQIQRFRVSFIWSETQAAIIDHTLPKAAFAFLGTRSSYQETFTQIINSPNGMIADLNISFPWERDLSSDFWSEYVLGEKRTIRNVTSGNAWEHLVPFRGKTPFKIVPWPVPYFALEIFYYPHGFACVLTAYFEGQFTLTEAVQQALDLQNGQFIIYEGGLSRSLNGLDELVEEVMGSIRRRVFRTEQGSYTRPFTVVTIIQGSGVPLRGKVRQKGQIHKALEGLANRNPHFLYSGVTPLEQADLLRSLPPPEPPPSHILYATPRSRVIWYPLDFSGNQKSTPLSNLHRHLVFATMQVDSLCGLIMKCDQEDIAVAALPAVRRECLCFALDRLGPLYGEASFDLLHAKRPRTT